MLIITSSSPNEQLKRFTIRIVTSGETACQTAIARNSQQAWNVAFDLAERLLGDKPPRSISVKPAKFGSGLYHPIGQALVVKVAGACSPQTYFDTQA